MATLAQVKKPIEWLLHCPAGQLTHAEMVGIWYAMRNAEYRHRIQSEMNYQLGESREKGWKQPEPYRVDWPKVTDFLNDLYERVGLGRPVITEDLELAHISDRRNTA